MSTIRQVIRKILIEALLEPHFNERLVERFLNRDFINVGYDKSITHVDYEVVGEYKIPEQIKEQIYNDVKIIENFNFPKNKSFGIKLTQIVIDKNQVVYNSEESKENAKNKKLIFVDDVTGSNGDVAYAIIRENKAITIYFGKSYIKQTADKLKVDVVANVDTVRTRKIHQ